ncbi:PAS domain S-box protein [bacterium]|nr:PAS domain S-box protein [bacterium]
MEKQEKNILNSEEYKKIVENTSDLITIASFSIKPVYIYISPSHKRILGYISKDLVGKPSFDIIHPDDKKRLFLLLKQYISAKAKKLLTKEKLAGSEKIEYRIKDKKGNWHNLESTVNLLGNKLLFVSRDVTEQKKVEKTLRENKSKLQLLYDSSSDAIMLLDEKSFFDCNDATLQLFGCSTKEVFCSKHPSDFSPPTQPDGTDSMSYTKNNILRALKEGSARFEHLHRRLDGKDFPAEVLLDAFMLAGKKVLQARVFDITERRRIEEKLKKSEEKMRNIIEHSNEMFFIHDINHKLSYVSPQSSAILGYTPEEMMIEWTELATDNSLNKKGIEITEKAIKTGEKQEIYRLELQRKDKIKIIVEVDEAPLKDGNNKVIGMIGAVRDITERKQAEEEVHKRNLELEEANRLMVGRELKMIELKKRIKKLEENN